MMQSLLLAVGRHVRLHRASTAVAGVALATGLVLAARLVDIPPVPHWTDIGYDAGADISLPFVAIFSGGGILVGCTLALALVQRRAWSILACCIYFLVFIPAAGWLGLATVGDLFGAIYPLFYLPPSQAADGIQVPLHLGGLALLGLAATMVGHLVQGALRGERAAEPSGWLGWDEDEPDA